MDTTTVLAEHPNLDGSTQNQRWIDLVEEHGHTGATHVAIVDAIRQAHRDEVGRLLPPGCSWLSWTSQIIGPAGTELPADLGTLLVRAEETVTGRLRAIEVRVTAATIRERRERARAELAEATAAVRDAYRLLRSDGCGQSEAARLLGIARQSAVNWDLR